MEVVQFVVLTVNLRGIFVVKPVDCVTVTCAFSRKPVKTAPTFRPLIVPESDFCNIIVK